MGDKSQIEELWMSSLAQEQTIMLCAVISIIFGLYNVYKVLSIEVRSTGYARGDIELQNRGDQASDEQIESQMNDIAILI